MPEEQKDVNTTEPSAVEQQTEQVAEPVQQTEQPTEAPVTAAPTPVPTVSDVDEFGVPWKNRAAEWRRKSEDLAEKLPQIVEEKLQSVLSQQTGERKYTVEELEAFSAQTDNPAYAQWARSEIRKRERDEQATVVRNEIGKWQKEQQDNIRKTQSFNYVIQNYPEVIIKTPTGQFVGFNQANPLFQQMNQIMTNPKFANDPEGLAAAADIAYARLQRSQQPMVQQQVQKQKEEIKSLQRNTLVEGGGKQTTQAIPAHRAAIDKLKQTGSMKDAQAALEAIFAARRQSQEQE